jgi:hypothetical protein
MANGKTLEGKQELAQVKTAAITKREEVPEFMRDVDPSLGLEEMDRGDIVLPRLAIAQTLSPALKKSGPRYIPGLEEGMLYNTVTREIYGTNVKVVPIIFTKMRIYFKDIKDGGGIICQSLNGIDGGHLCPAGCAGCEHSQWINNEAPDCNDFKNYACVLPEYENSIVVVSMKSTAIGVAKQWNAMMRMLRKPAFAKTYEIKTVEETKGNNTYQQWHVTQLNYVSQELYDAATGFYEQLKAHGVKVSLDDEDELQDDSFNTNTMEGAAQEM